jgi:hypothetical protein
MGLVPDHRLSSFSKGQDDTTQCARCGTDYDAGRHGYADGECPDCRQTHDNQ